MDVSSGVSLSFFSILTMAFQFRNRPYVTQGGGDPQSVVNFLGDIKGDLTHQSLRVVLAPTTMLDSSRITKKVTEFHHLGCCDEL